VAAVFSSSKCAICGLWFAFDGINRYHISESLNTEVLILPVITQYYIKCSARFSEPIIRYGHLSVCCSGILNTSEWFTVQVCMAECFG